MIIQFDQVTRAARADATETAIGASPILEMRTGTIPANCAAATTGTLVASMVLPADFLTNPGTGVKALLGLWEDLLANNSGVIGYFRIFDSTGASCRMQGDVSEAGGGGAMIVNNADVNAGQPVAVISFTLTEGNA